MFARTPVLIASAQFDNSAAAASASDGVFSLIDVLSSSRPKPVFSGAPVKNSYCYMYRSRKKVTKHLEKLSFCGNNAIGI